MINTLPSASIDVHLSKAFRFKTQERRSLRLRFLRFWLERISMDAQATRPLQQSLKKTQLELLSSHTSVVCTVVKKQLPSTSV